MNAWPNSHTWFNYYSWFGHAKSLHLLLQMIIAEFEVNVGITFAEEWLFICSKLAGVCPPGLLDQDTLLGWLICAILAEVPHSISSHTDIQQ